MKGRPLTLKQAKALIEKTLDTYSRPHATAKGLVPAALTRGKIYECWALCTVLENLTLAEKASVELVNGTRVVLKSSPGPINPKYSHFQIEIGASSLVAWTDVEFTTLSSSLRTASTSRKSDYHELDIVLVPKDTVDRPSHDDIRLGVECKCTLYTKELLRSILGVRRELSHMSSTGERTHFTAWPRATVPCSPNSCLVVYSSDRGMLDYSDPGDVFGIDFIVLEPPSA